MSEKPIYVTQPYLPPLEEFLPYLEEIWDSKILTNGGPMHQRLEAALADYLGVHHVALFNNATIALLTALQGLRVTGEVITTPYSFVATAHSILWNGLTPVFVDIDPVTLNMDPTRIEEAITPLTTAIMPVHCYGNACDVDAIQRIATTHGLKVIYDAAHAFGVRDGGGSILRHGDLSVLSFHATKAFNTFEGGAIVCPDAETKRHIDQLKNFGFVDEVTVVAAGINGKMSEFNAALGLLQLKHADAAIAARLKVDEIYRRELDGVAGLRIPPRKSMGNSNGSYFPVFIDDEYPLERDDLYGLLKTENIFARRYFYPLISSFPMYSSLASARPENLRTAEDAASRILCLPIYPHLTETEQTRIIRLVKDARQ
ncbi:MAG: DegT/DnrJ/EryC1/StrS family aminotransferase [Myxococcota bacterium]|jgi:dTDP-4-amino-4,6-dideoxygalactose transaminase